MFSISWLHILQAPSGVRTGTDGRMGGGYCLVAIIAECSQAACFQPHQKRNEMIRGWCRIVQMCTTCLARETWKKRTNTRSAARHVVVRRGVMLWHWLSEIGANLWSLQREWKRWSLQNLISVGRCGSVGLRFNFQASSVWFQAVMFRFSSSGYLFRVAASSFWLLLSAFLLSDSGFGLLVSGFFLLVYFLDFKLLTSCFYFWILVRDFWFQSSAF